MRIAIIGAGAVGQALAQGWSTAGHTVKLGVPDPKAAKYQGLRPQPTTPAAAAADAEAIVLATPWPKTEAAIGGLGNLAGRIVIDCTNPLTRGAQGMSLEIGHSVSAGKRVAQWAKGASVFKTLNHTGADNMANAARFKVKPAMFVAGDDAAKKPAVLKLVSDLGFDAIDAGPLSNARLLEPLAMLWIDQVFARGRGRDFAFALVKRG
ncbi:MAG: NAD(P)-binding domain-containing protein [Alphaproteobacteria bacterium]|nr:NAD(P)-binding domain-containing protein [Alphaproteobacteria bacterium]